jgi:hypothetical protein
MLSQFRRGLSRFEQVMACYAKLGMVKSGYDMFGLVRPG